MMDSPLTFETHHLFTFTVVMKSSEVTPLATLKFAELVKEAGFPAVSI
jgi:acyl-CoA reductase-like NAD-dependent aldehyde dehydrogenase